MSTRAIEAVLQRALLRETGEEKDQVARAFEQLRSIESAAKTLADGVRGPLGWNTPSIHNAFNAIVSIGEEAP